MCGRFTSLLTPDLLSVIFQTFGCTPPADAESRYNIAPTTSTWVIRRNAELNRCDLMRWGLIPHWAKDRKIGTSLINARSETAHEKPSFRQALKQRRLVVPAGGFYEWERSGEKKVPHYIRMATLPRC